METSGYLDAVHENTALFVAAGVKAGLETPVPTCPDWNVAGLAAHQGRIFRWVSAIVEKGSQKFIHPDALEQLEEGENPLYWLKAGAERALEALDAADPEAKVWNWFDGSPRRPGGGTGGWPMRSSSTGPTPRPPPAGRAT